MIPFEVNGPEKVKWKYCSAVAYPGGGRGGSFPPPETQKNLQRIGNNPGLSQQ